MKQQRSGFSVMRRLIVLVRPLAPFMALAVLLGVAGFVCAIFLTILGGWAILEVLGLGAPLALGGPLGGGVRAGGVCGGGFVVVGCFGLGWALVGVSVWLEFV